MQDASTRVNVGGSLFDTAEVMLTLDHPSMVAYLHGSPSASDLRTFYRGDRDRKRPGTTNYGLAVYLNNPQSRGRATCALDGS
ncbi:hypothetical protein SPRG_02785 [Saprolegnia parasitica CBS 223.65]|uniref:Uncharacterized protein n=1 Tax=Saprolegnia parasitica (strain CBS 223.65) TaxID=695850 RepID=A0A067D0M1_SAPPC|nr:hypothetical protein SPRG_02785 [Saprolegnia parasitica CBS 223.65]KDO32306.1 hypothetical protein SPRG_02785 [Saprolegnia parasitica CBS 223.65]|eukprot:XP_012196762.1 hypothetical protein SPRG_02785 [Saprolegnia parasitica CBS 223.65]